jgi:excisionase family DNA binding protein
MTMTLEDTRELTYVQAAAFLNLPLRTVRTLVASGDLPVIRHNARVHRLPVAGLERWRDKQTDQSVRVTAPRKRNRAPAPTKNKRKAS